MGGRGHEISVNVGGGSGRFSCGMNIMGYCADFVGSDSGGYVTTETNTTKRDRRKNSR